MNKCLLISSLVFLFASCSPSVSIFTQQTREKYKLSPEDLKSIQFYVQGDIVLNRFAPEAKKETEEGTLTLVREDVLERIVIKSGTPCLVRDVIDGSRVTVSFEDGQDKFLVFGSIKNQDGAYTLQALDWKRDSGGKLNYGNKEFVASPQSRNAFLYLKQKSLDRSRLEQSVVKGKTLK